MYGVIVARAHLGEAVIAVRIGDCRGTGEVAVGVGEDSCAHKRVTEEVFDSTTDSGECVGGEDDDVATHLGLFGDRPHKVSASVSDAVSGDLSENVEISFSAASDGVRAVDARASLAIHGPHAGVSDRLSVNVGDSTTDG